MREEKILLSAQFDPKVQHYMMLSVVLVLAITFIGIPLIPVWFIIGRSFHRKQWECMECDLTERSLNIRRGVLFKLEKNIPLDKIQDLAVREGPLLRRLGLSSLAVETAGSSNPQSGADATLSGVVGAPAFRDAVLNQRDLVVTTGVSAPRASSPSRSAPGEPAADVLVEIRDSLHRIEGLLGKRTD